MLVVFVILTEIRAIFPRTQAVFLLEFEPAVVVAFIPFTMEFADQSLCPVAHMRMNGEKILQLLASDLIIIDILRNVECATAVAGGVGLRASEVTLDAQQIKHG